MTTYADGSALARALATDPESVSWLRWSAQHADDLVTSPLGLAQLRHVARGMDAVARGRAHEIATRTRVVRFSDQAVEHAAVLGLDAFRALHLGVVLAEAGVGGLATYDVALARAADLEGVAVLTPGRHDGWWFAAS
ncbi:PIN domain-containing protein [Cellulomonas carbonis]|uniref:Toxin VapC n=1 Tax=Cellulomonas carbonis T26 TaxID=947969 RepID=A0A0A0BMY4_9CELL|nr:PIN domain-containing protein [Cellulomonas carbonis]KGM09062.1 hypothetical protein N868_03300 [Cellulomonas carbonis T26]GGC02911.1 hypothetical protein GCM10010972_14910 [Cellulomonas carbonis]